MLGVDQKVNVKNSWVEAQSTPRTCFQMPMNTTMNGPKIDNKNQVNAKT